MLGWHFVTMEPALVVRQVDALMPTWRMAVVENSDSRMWTCNPDQPIGAQQFVEVVLPILHGTALVDQLREEVHVRFEYDDEVIGYAIKRGALMKMSHEVRVRRIAQEMAFQLDCALRKEGVQ